MEILRIHFHFIIIFCSILLMLGSCSQGYLCHPNKYSALFIFGDSLFDAGNNNYIQNATFKANFWPYGQSFFNYPTGRFSDGRIIPDFIAEYEKLPLIPPFLQPGDHYYEYGVNFASAGVGALLETLQGKVVDLKTQIGYFKDAKKEIRQNLGDEESNSLISESLFLLSVGGNDYGFTKTSTAFQSYTPQEFVDIVIGNLSYVIKEIYKSGGRRFGIVNIGDYGCAPFMRAQNGSGGCFEEVTVLIRLHNIALSNLLKHLQTQLKGFEFSLLDFYTLLSERINNPSKYGHGDMLD
ncbi:GDSL esterase/lipase 1-like isoform X2 [Euphorbia lathyris]|uniref:GDSL esterase/lipase 1-like isoform X2 n=1 Tax=Euphorbia lathyris TaxID=212925 RepID=UPI003313C1F7